MLVWHAPALYPLTRPDHGPGLVRDSWKMKTRPPIRVRSRRMEQMGRRASYAIGDDGPYSEADLRRKLREYRDEHGEGATRRLAVYEIGDENRLGAGRRIDVGQFLD